MKKNKKLTKWDYHELLDRTCLLAEQVHENLCEHQVSKKHKKIKKKLDKASVLLYEVYADIANIK